MQKDIEKPPTDTKPAPKPRPGDREPVTLHEPAQRADPDQTAGAVVGDPAPGLWAEGDLGVEPSRLALLNGCAVWVTGLFCRCGRAVRADDVRFADEGDTSFICGACHTEVLSIGPDARGW